MIPGNIDLTENLDFRNVRKRNIPQLPSSWKGKPKINNFSANSDNIITTSSNNITWTYSMDDGSDMTIRNYRLVYHDDWISWNDYNEYDYLTTRTSITYTNNDDVYFSDYNTTRISNKLGIWVSKEDEYDIFGNRIKAPEVIRQMPYKFDAEKRHEHIDRICWEKYERKWTRFDPDYIPPIPWEEEDDDWFALPRKVLLTPYKRAKNFICWLRNKSRSFIENEINEGEEEVDMSYLTNMSWIRVKDAEIDSI